MEVVDRNNRPLEVGDWVMFHFDDGPVDGVSPGVLPHYAPISEIDADGTVHLPGYISPGNDLQRHKHDDLTWWVDQ